MGGGERSEQFIRDTQSLMALSSPEGGGRCTHGRGHVHNERPSAAGRGIPGSSVATRSNSLMLQRLKDSLLIQGPVSAEPFMTRADFCQMLLPAVG